MRRNGAALRTVLATAAALLVTPALAQAATTIGQVSPPGLGITCNTGGGSGELVQLLNATGNGYAVPAGGGVITNWSTAASGGVGTIRLRVYSADSNATSITPVAESDPVEFAPDPAGAHPTRIPVKGGEHIGFAVSATGGTGCAFANNANADVVVVSRSIGPLNQAKPIALPDAAAQSTALLSIAAGVEADADGDGYGDETQDRCPSQAATHDACSNSFTIGATQRNKKQGTATVEVSVPGPGNLSLTGTNLASQGFDVGTAGPGAAKLFVKATGKTKRKLAKKGKVTVEAEIAYTPVGGEGATQSVPVKLKRKSKKKH